MFKGDKAKLKNMWQNMLHGSKELFGEGNEMKLLFEKFVDVLFGEVTKTYVKMGIGKFLRDFRRDIEWKKDEAHRKKVQMRTEGTKG